jgi:hypothetical protein
MWEELITTYVNIGVVQLIRDSLELQNSPGGRGEASFPGKICASFRITSTVPL